MTGRERILNCLEKRPIDRLPFMPITMMFAADHAGVPYRAYATDHRVLVEAQLRTAEAYGFDYVSCISDPAREAADCGAAVHFFDNQPPALDESRARLADKTELARLPMPDPLGGTRMRDRIEAAALFRERAAREYLIEGWVEGPCAEAADLRGINALMMDFYEDPAFVADLFEFVLELGLRFARAQIEAGADLIGVGDAAASLVGPDLYEAFVFPCEKRLVEGIHATGGRVRLHICGNTRPILDGMGRLGCDIVDLDYMVPMDEARAAMGPAQVLLGNLDPVAVVRNGSPEQIREAVAACHRQAGPAYIVGAGCEIVRDTPPDNLRAMAAYAHSFPLGEA
ncbi:MAG TPA: uroporphyrinogen decarboxylase family protein [Candidatus Hydrogenedentes bacterium]|nr:uroporphyrinogen decarboxylase family protein [Candidatus Hydrogenedentota bacterium]HRT21439.1 uroporphyrinogen decarboxylase family protein [Candidatus Hydrogenedentota bacterium]HRT66327.1 uroporphyrinogen decarboxylase family protein [Candidatus Hydrogenedentota bacterium]